MALTAEQLERIRAHFPTLRVEPSCTMIDSYFGEHVTLEQGVTIEGVAIGNGVRVGANSRVSHCRIGDGMVIAAHSAITRDVGAAPFVEDPDSALPLGEFLLEKLPQSNVFTKWRAAEGDARLRLDYPLDGNSVVVDVGGFRGDFAAEMVKRYGCRVEVFEPVAKFAAEIAERLRNEARVRVHRFGLAGRTREERIAVAAESSSTLRTVGEANGETIQLCAAKGVLADLADLTGRIDLMKINIEGGEYELLEHLLREDLVERIGYLQIQFHNFVTGAAGRRRELRQQLGATHHEMWNFPFIWESWEAKNESKKEQRNKRWKGR